VWHHVASHVSERLARLPLALMLVGLFFWLYPEAIWLPSLGNILLFVPVVALAFTVRFLIQYTFALFAFGQNELVRSSNFGFCFTCFCLGVIAP
jgi:ABC-2 type transport system permease protein